MNNLHKSYIKDDILLTNFIDIEDETLLKILQWRNHKDIRKWMFNQSKISINEHLDFCDSLRHDNSKAYWLLSSTIYEIGIIYLSSYDFKSKIGIFGFYLNPQFFLTHLPLTLFFTAMNFFFDELQLLAVKGFVRSTNSSALILNDFFGMIHKCFIFIDNNYYSERLITRDEWLKKRQNIKVEMLQKHFFSFVKSTR